PARRAADEAQTPLPGEAVYLVDDAVDVVRQLGAVLAELGIGFQHRLNRAANVRALIDRESPALELFEELPLRLPAFALERAPGVSVKTQWACGRNGGIELAQGACGGVARVGEDLGVLLGLRLVEGRKVLLCHEDFAADLDQRRYAPLQLRGHVLDGL